MDSRSSSTSSTSSSYDGSVTSLRCNTPKSATRNGSSLYDRNLVVVVLVVLVVVVLVLVVVVPVTE